jgi:hypothetical protein
LLSRGVDDFIRVGCLKRIAKPILKYTLRESGTSEERIDQESIKDLNEMLKVNAVNPFPLLTKFISAEFKEGEK